MATSSITKQFIAKDVNAFKNLIEDAEKIPVRKPIANEISSLDRGRISTHFSYFSTLRITEYWAYPILKN